jgi:hypothetical protein
VCAALIYIEIKVLLVSNQPLPSSCMPPPSARPFSQGERLPYVLLAGEKLQEDAAEDPLTAAKAGREGDLGLYWKVRWWGGTCHGGRYVSWGAGDRARSGLTLQSAAS